MQPLLFRLKNKYTVSIDTLFIYINDNMSNFMSIHP